MTVYLISSKTVNQTDPFEPGLLETLRLNIEVDGKVYTTNIENVLHQAALCCTKLYALTVRYDQLSDDNAIAIGRMFHGRLKTLNIFSNCMTANGAKSLLEALQPVSGCVFNTTCTTWTSTFDEEIKCVCRDHAGPLATEPVITVEAKNVAVSIKW